MTIIARTCKATSKIDLVSWTEAVNLITKLLGESKERVERTLSRGFPIETDFSTYQHRDWVEGCERPDPKTPQDAT